MAAAEPTDEGRELLIKLANERDIRNIDLGDFSLSIARFCAVYGTKAESFVGVAKQFVVAGKDTLGILTPTDVGRIAAETAETAKEKGLSPSEALATIVTLARAGKIDRFAAKADE